MDEPKKDAPAPQPVAEETTAAPEAAAAQPPAKDTHAIHEIRGLVKEGLQSAGCEVKDIIIQGLHKEEIAKRAAAAQKVMEKISAAEDELKKIRPKHLGVNLKGEPAGEPVYQPEDAKKHKELTDQLTKLHAAFNRGIREHNFDKMLELGK